MTSNAYLAEYIERVQELLSVFSISDHDAREHIRLSDYITKYNPKFLIFEILFLNREEKMFDPHVSDLTISYPNYPDGIEPLVEDIKRLYKNKQDLNFDWVEINAHIELDNRVDELRKRNLLDLPRELKELDEFYEQIEDGSKNFDENKYQRAVEILKKLIKRYEVEYVPSNLGVNALLYEAWQRGEFLYFSHDTGAGKAATEEKFNQIINALFIEADIDADVKVEDIAKNLSLLDIFTEESTLFDGRSWLRRSEKQWFKCVEYSLIHRTIESNQKSFNRYLIHYPLIIDDYRFVGFAYLYSNWDSLQNSEKPELFVKAKYPKVYHYTQSVSESLSSSLRRDALAKALKSYEEEEEEIFYQAVKEYFVCFDVLREEDGVSSEIQERRKLIYEGHGIKIYGPQWIRKKHQELLEQEIEGKQVLGEENIPGLWQSVQEKKQRRESLQLSGWQKRSSQMSHQAAGLVAEVWCDPKKTELQSQTVGCLWHLKTLIDVWGSRDLKGQGSISAGPEADFPDWETFPGLEVLDRLVDIGLAHALRRATSTHTERDEDQVAINRALKIVGSDNAVEQFRTLLNIHIEVDGEDENLDWLTLRGFALCFHHCFWQAAYHAFRSVCVSGQHHHSHHLIIQIGNRQVNVINCADAADYESQKSNNFPPRDKEFFETLNKRIGEICTIGGPTLKDGFWQTTISLVL